MEFVQQQRKPRDEGNLNTLPALLYSMTIDQALAGVRAQIPDFSGIKAGERVLDVCCGTGAQAICYAKQGIICQGVDMDAGMIEFAERRRRRLGLSNSSFQRASATHLPFRDASFDHASISMGLHEKAKQSRDWIVSEMRRVVKPGGTLTILDYRMPYPGDARARAVGFLEQMAGKEHYRCFREFISDGGLDSLLSRHLLREDKREYPHGLPLVLLKLHNT